MSQLDTPVASRLRQARAWSVRPGLLRRKQSLQKSCRWR